jgi:hypothetical protein
MRCIVILLPSLFLLSCKASVPHEAKNEPPKIVVDSSFGKDWAQGYPDICLTYEAEPKILRSWKVKADPDTIRFAGMRLPAFSRIIDACSAEFKSRGDRKEHGIKTRYAVFSESWSDPATYFANVALEHSLDVDRSDHDFCDLNCLPRTPPPLTKVIITLPSTDVGCLRTTREIIVTQPKPWSAVGEITVVKQTHLRNGSGVADEKGCFGS